MSNPIPDNSYSSNESVIFLAVLTVVPDPINGSNITPLFTSLILIQCSTNPSGNVAGWNPFCDLFHIVS